MIGLQEYIIEHLEYEINEHLVDNFPQLIFIIGLPAAGKSTFIKNDLKKYFPNVITNRTFDSDITLQKKQREVMFTWAEKLYYTMKNDLSENVFNVLVSEQEDKINSDVAMRNRTNKFKITTTFEWVKSHIELPLNKFLKEFDKDFFKRNWGINFTVRPLSKQEYKSVIAGKMDALDSVDNIESFNNNDIIVPILGSNIDDIYDMIDDVRLKQGKNSYIPSVIFLDMPVEVAIEKDEGRRKKEGRGIGKELIEEKAPAILQTWHNLKSGSWKRHGIYKLLHFVWLPVENRWGEYKLQKMWTNTDLVKSFLK